MVNVEFVEVIVEIGELVNDKAQGVYCQQYQKDLIDRLSQLAFLSRIGNKDYQEREHIDH